MVAVSYSLPLRDDGGEVIGPPWMTGGGYGALLTRYVAGGVRCEACADPRCTLYAGERREATGVDMLWTAVGAAMGMVD